MTSGPRTRFAARTLSDVPPIDWSEHRQPNMLLPVSRRTLLWLVLGDVAVSVVVVASLGNPRTSLASALVLAMALACLPAGMAAHRLRRRKPPFRFGLPATALITGVLWGTCAFLIFIRTYQTY